MPPAKAGFEIERKYLLSRAPDVPPEARRMRLEQGYLRPDPEADVVAGRLRRIEHADGTIEHIHTIKSGAGLVRREIERPLTAEQFLKLWPRTEGARLRKTRWELPIGPVLWVVDVFDDRDLVLAEVELPTETTVADPPAWLADHIVREVTEEKAYRNFVIATTK